MTQGCIKTKNEMPWTHKNDTCLYMCVCVTVLIQEKLEASPKRDIEGMGVGEIKYGDSICFVMHMATGLWLSYQAPDAKSARLGPLKRRVTGFNHACPLYTYDNQAHSSVSIV